MTDVADGGSASQRRRTVWLAVGAVVLAAVAVGAFVVSQDDDGSDGSSGSGTGSSSTTTTEPADPTTTEPAGTTGSGPGPSSCPPSPLPEPAPAGPDDLVFRPVLAVVPPGVCDDAAGWIVDDEGSSYQLGPAAAPGMIESAEAEIGTSGDWVISLTLKEGRPGIDDFNDLAAECEATGAGCPTGQVAVVVGDEVVTAPSIQEPAFERDAIQISGDFTGREAEALADRIG